jgi:hypothetical protein
MAELITGRGGTDHVDSEDFGALNAVTLGDGTYILSGCSMAMKTASTLHIAAGELLMQGRHVRIKGAGEDIDVAVGTTGYNRNDLVALHYKQEGGIESVSVEVVAGTPTTGAASDPELGGGSILNGDAEAYVAIARVPIVGLAPSEPVVLVGGLKSNSQLAESISAIRDSVSRPLFKTVKYTSPNSDVGSGNVLEYSGTLKNFAGYTPVGIVETNTNHDWSFGLMRATLNGDGTFTCTWMNFNKNTWRGSIGYATVLYIRS